MGSAYTPGLSIAERTIVRVQRRLPIRGRVLVHVGQRVTAEEVVAETELPGDIRSVNVARQLGIAEEDLLDVILKREGETTAKDEPLAQTHGLFGWFKVECRSPIDGTVESVSTVTGQVILRGRPIPLQKQAYIAGTVVDVQENESATIEAQAAFVQGVFGLGGEAVGRLEVVVDSPDDVLDGDHVGPEHRGKIVVGGSLVTTAAIRAAREHGVRGILAGGLNDTAVRDVLGYELGVAITGQEELGVTVVITEGFGVLPMAHATFELLREHDGALASINGATQIRAGVIRPEVIVPLPGPRLPQDSRPEAAGVLEIGTRLRAIREPYFGRLGRCTVLPAELTKLASETQTRVVEVEFDDGTRAVLPRANVELINA
jgi:hypothetical protein